MLLLIALLEYICMTILLALYLLATLMLHPDLVKYKERGLAPLNFLTKEDL